jgi:Ca-activated chloride channel family protein
VSGLDVGAWIGLAAALIVGAIAWWREHARAGARQAWHGPAVTVRRRPLRGLVRVVLLAIAAGSATASVIGLTGAGDGDPAQTNAPESILIALDVSRSMDATDVAPSRLIASREWLGRLVDRASPRAVGHVLFAGEAMLTCPLTSDLAALRMALDETTATQGAIQGGSVRGPALTRSVAAFGEGRARRTLIVVSDGEDTGSGVADAIAAAKATGVVVHTVGVGTANGIAMAVRRPPPGQLVAPDAETRVTKLEEKPLRELATATGGLYVAGLDDRSLAVLAGRLRAPRPPDQPAQTIWWTALLLASFVCLVLERLWPERRVQVAAATVASLLVLLVPASARAADGWEALRAGNALLDRGRTREAITAYRQAAEEPALTAIAWFNVGVALARQEEPKNAAMAFARAAAFYKTDAETRVTKLEEKPLRELATATGGLYVAGLDDRSLAVLAGRLRAPTPRTTMRASTWRSSAPAWSRRSRRSRRRPRPRTTSRRRCSRCRSRTTPSTRARRSSGR